MDESYLSDLENAIQWTWWQTNATYPTRAAKAHGRER